MTSPVFLVPDVLSEILEQVDCVERGPYWRPLPFWWPQPSTEKSRSLLRCQLVNSLWFNEASRIIWRTLPSFKHLIKVEDGHRRQRYVKMVREFTLEDDHYSPGPFEFTRLETLRILSCNNVDNAHLLLMPTVKHFQVSSHAKSNGFETFDRRCPNMQSLCGFETLDRRCPNMQSLCLHLEMTLSPELMESLKQYLAVTTARRVEIRAWFDYTEKLLPVLAQNDNVRELVNIRIGQNAVHNIIQSGIKQPFKHLNYFSGIGGPIGLRDLLSIMPNVEHLVIDQLYFGPQTQTALNLNVVIELASANLKRIYMCTDRYKAEKSRLLALAMRFPQLESVQLYSKAPDFIALDASEILDDEFAHEFTRRLPNLKVIELQFDYESLTSEGLISIAKNCPFLEVLNLLGDRPLAYRYAYPGWRKQSLFNCPIFSAEKEPLFPRLIYFKPLVTMTYLPRWMQKYHFPIIFGELERKFGMASSDPDACRHWFAKIRTRLFAE